MSISRPDLGILALLVPLLPIVAALVIWVWKYAWKLQLDDEVKLNTGEEPVLKKERETDHG